MDIQNRTELKEFAAQRLENVPAGKRLATIYAAVVVGMSILSAVINYVLGLQIDQTGGLSNMGTRTMLSTLQNMLPLVQALVLMCVELGYMSAMLRIARGQYASPNALRLGFDRFWVLLRYTIVENLIFMGIGMASMYLGIMIFLMTPLSNSVTELLMPLISQSTLLDPSVIIPDALYDQLMTALVPGLIICGVIFCAVGVPMMYKLRMAPYVIIDKPGLGALAALRESKKMMRRNGMHLFKLDVSLWRFYLATIGASIVCYGDMILPKLGIPLPLPEDVSFFLFYGLYWAAEFAIFYFLRNRVEVTYALAYDAILPREEQSSGVVLGNIFQM